VRNPLARMASTWDSFASGFRTRLADDRPGEPCEPAPFAAFALNVRRVMGSCAARKCCYYSRQRWYQDAYVAAHFMEQSQRVFSSSSASAVDFIGRTERLGEDWREFVRALAVWSGREVQDVDDDELREISGEAAGEFGSVEWAPLCDGEKYAELYTSERVMRSMALQFARDLTEFEFL